MGLKKEGLVGGRSLKRENKQRERKSIVRAPHLFEPSSLVLLRADRITGWIIRAGGESIHKHYQPVESYSSTPRWSFAQTPIHSLAAKPHTASKAVNCEWPVRRLIQIWQSLRGGSSTYNKRPSVGPLAFPGVVVVVVLVVRSAWVDDVRVRCRKGKLIVRNWADRQETDRRHRGALRTLLGVSCCIQSRPARGTSSNKQEEEKVAKSQKQASFLGCPFIGRKTPSPGPSA